MLRLPPAGALFGRALTTKCVLGASHCLCSSTRTMQDLPIWLWSLWQCDILWPDCCGNIPEFLLSKNYIFKCAIVLFSVFVPLSWTMNGGCLLKHVPGTIVASEFAYFVLVTIALFFSLSLFYSALTLSLLSLLQAKHFTECLCVCREVETHRKAYERRP